MTPAPQPKPPALLRNEAPLCPGWVLGIGPACWYVASLASGLAWIIEHRPQGAEISDLLRATRN